MFEHSPVTIHSSRRPSLSVTPDGSEKLTADNPAGSVLVGQSGDVSLTLPDGRVLTVWPNLTVTLTSVPDEDDEEYAGRDTGVTFELPDADTVSNGMTMIPVRYL